MKRIVFAIVMIFSLSTFASINFSIDKSAEEMELNDAADTEQSYVVERGDLTQKQFNKRVRRFCKRIKKECKKANEVSNKECRQLKKDCMNANGVKSRMANFRKGIKNVVKKIAPKLSSLFKKGKDDNGQFVEATIKNKLIAKLDAFKQMIGKKSFAEKKAGADAIVIRTYLNDKTALKDMTLPGERPFPRWLKIDGVRERFSNVDGWTLKKTHRIFFDADKKVLGVFIKADKTNIVFEQIDDIKKKIAGPIVGALIPTPDYIPFPIKAKKEKIGRVSIMSNYKDEKGTAGVMVMVDYKKLHAML